MEAEWSFEGRVGREGAGGKNTAAGLNWLLFWFKMHRRVDSLIKINLGSGSQTELGVKLNVAGF